MDNVTDVPTLPVGFLDDWLNGSQPSVTEVVDRLTQIRQLARQTRLAEAHIIDYVREHYGLDECEPDPDVVSEEQIFADL